MICFNSVAKSTINISRDHFHFTHLFKIKMALSYDDKAAFILKRILFRTLLQELRRHYS